MNDLIFIIAQIIGIAAFIVSLIAYHRNKKEKILGNMVLSSIFNLIHYFLLGAYSGCVTKAIAICRDLFIISKDKRKKSSTNIYLYIFILIYFLVGIFTYKNIWSIFPIIAAMIYIVPVWNGSEKIVKKAAFICYFLWLLYNICVCSISGVISNIISIISVFLAIKSKNNTNLEIEQ